MSQPIDSPAETPTVLYIFRLQLLRLLLICGVSATLLLWVTEVSAAKIIPLDLIAYPVMTVILSIVCVMLFLRPQMLEQLEAISFTTFTVYVVFHAQPLIMIGNELYPLASLILWFPLVYTSAFFFLSARRALLVSGLVYLSVLIPYGLVFALNHSVFPVADGDLLILNMFASHPVYIVTLSGIARLKAQVVQAQAQARQLHSAASLDFLTGVANRRTATLRLQQDLTQPLSESPVVSVIMLDIDRFKLVNDTRGHEVGDQVLIQIATILQENLRGEDMLARWGGEEFIVVANLSGAEVQQMAERLRSAVTIHLFPQVGHLTASFGVATAGNGDTPESLVKRADEALYLAKQHGRNRVETAHYYARSQESEVK